MRSTARIELPSTSAARTRRRSSSERTFATGGLPCSKRCAILALPFQLTDRLAVVVMTPIDDVVIVGVFFDGQLGRMIEDAVGEA